LLLLFLAMATDERDVWKVRNPMVGAAASFFWNRLGLVLVLTYWSITSASSHETSLQLPEGPAG